MENRVNRILKFRVWDVKLKSFIKEFEGNFVLDNEGNLRCINCFRERNDFIVQQFVGLLDFEGKEIFEGDILKDGLGEILGSVRYVSGEWLIGRNYSLVQFWDNETFKQDTCKMLIIGNILENPDYLRE